MIILTIYKLVWYENYLLVVGDDGRCESTKVNNARTLLLWCYRNLLYYISDFLGKWFHDFCCVKVSFFTYLVLVSVYLGLVLHIQLGGLFLIVKEEVVKVVLSFFFAVVSRIYIISKPYNMFKNNVFLLSINVVAVERDLKTVLGSSHWVAWSLKSGNSA